MNDKKETENNTLSWDFLVLCFLFAVVLGYGAHRVMNRPGITVTGQGHVIRDNVVTTSLPPPPKFFPNSDVKIPAELDARIHTLRVNEWKGNLYEEVVRLMARGATMRVAFGTVMIAQREVKKSDAYTVLTDYDRATLDEATENFQSEMFELIPSEGAKPTQ